MFLTDEELHQLTGYLRNADRCRWLRKAGWRFEKSARNGRPVVLRSYAEARLSGISAQAVKTEPQLKLSSIRG